MTLISADNDFAIMAVLFVIAGAAFLAERTRIGAHLTGAVIAILAAIVAANLRIIPHAAPAYDFVFSYFVPILIPLFLFKANLRTMLFETTRMTGAFLIAALGTIAGVLVAVSLLDLGSLAPAAAIDPEMREAGIAGLFTSTYIGGSVNYAALGEITGLRTDASFFSAATATDNLFSAVFLSILALLPGWNWLARRFTRHEHGEEQAVAERTDTISATSLTLALATAISFVAIGDAVTAMLGWSSLRYAIITVLVVSAATAFPGWMERLHGAFEIGVGLAFVFFTAIAAGANLVAMVSIAPLLVVLVVILLGVHLLVLLGVGGLFRLTLPELVTASNAAVLGATTAPALAAARGWHDLVTPGVLVGVLGYALGTFAGTAVFHWL
ncbi:MAG: DUF819 family protein [Gammaproteobacteria bacterium]|nr:DUF819 family protein [Gammaproteobacteria bacterium]MBT8105417.1 DUF819 family protein [Gammaproteobacteria bacterium]NNK25431.1 DUF819 family protein [Woeseiaceae bacterium]NNL63398.1 DUF819 family protein [Woeseiaceae bacterium]